MGTSKSNIFLVRVWIYILLISVLWGRNEFVCCAVERMNCSYVGIEVDLVLVWWSELSSFQCGGSKLTWFYCKDWCWLGLCAGVENGLVSVSTHRNWRYFKVKIEVDLVSVLGSKLTWFLCAGRRWLRFNSAIEIDSVLQGGSKITWVLRLGRNGIVISVGINSLGLCGWSKLMWFLCAGRKWLRFSVSSKSTWISVWVVEINLIFGVEVRIWLEFSVGDV